MKRRKTPPERKAEEYANEFRYEAWHSAHGDRQNRPQAKALEQRLRRREVQQVLTTAPAVTTEEQADELTTDATPVRQKSLRFNSTAVPLAEHLRRSEKRRQDAAGRRFFRRPYDRKSHREPFARFLDDVTGGGTADSVALAKIFKRLLASPERDAARLEQSRDSVRELLRGEHLEVALEFFGNRLPSLWLESFLRDEPAWRERLERWIEQTLSDHAGR